MREFVLDLQAPTRAEHEQSASWRGEIHILGDGRGYLRWGDEPSEDLTRSNRFIKLRNVADLVSPIEEYLEVYEEEEGVEIQALEDIRNLRGSYQGLEKTEREAVVQSRLGQGRFRSGLIDYWQGCAVTGCRAVEILRASHIKPWKVSSNEERLDPANGLLLTPNLDAAFDRGLISFDDAGGILISGELDSEAMDGLGIDGGMRLLRVEGRHGEYLGYHRKNIFRNK